MPWLAAAAVLATAWLAWPFLPWLLVAVWAAALVRPAHARLARRFGGRPRWAAVAITAVAVLAVVPIGVIVAAVIDDAVELARRALATDRARDLLHALTARRAGDTSSRDLLELAFDQGARAWSLAQRVAGTALHALAGLAIAIAGTGVFLLEGERWLAWLEAHAPVAPATFRRLANAVVETGRGLAFGFFGAGLAQAAVATILFLALDVPQPWALGVLTLAASAVPALGTALIWIPVVLALALDGREHAAVILALGGVLVISTIDNLVRPILARRGGHLQLPLLVVALAMFAGLATLGARGVLLGPLVVRLTRELLEIARERRA